MALALTFYHIILIILLIFSVEYDHPTLICKGNVITRDGRETTCDYYFPSKLTVQELSTEEYVMLLRREPIRELLMLPRPIREKDNFNHFDNEMLVKNSNFWSDLLKQQQCLTFYSIALNYGRWETQQSQDKYAQACHAHVHLYFNRETWESLKKMVNSREIIAKMNARNYPGPNYLLKDCMELEQQRLQSAEHQHMLNINNSLVNAINNNNNSLVNTINNNNNSLVNTINNNFNSLVDAINNNNNSLVNAINNNFNSFAEKLSKKLEV